MVNQPEGALGSAQEAKRQQGREQYVTDTSIQHRADALGVDLRDVNLNPSRVGLAPLRDQYIPDRALKRVAESVRDISSEHQQLEFHHLTAHIRGPGSRRGAVPDSVVSQRQRAHARIHANIAAASAPRRVTFPPESDMPTRSSPSTAFVYDSDEGSPLS